MVPLKNQSFTPPESTGYNELVEVSNPNSRSLIGLSSKGSCNSLFCLQEIRRGMMICGTPNAVQEVNIFPMFCMLEITIMYY